MSDIAIRVENLGKRYRIGQYVGYKTLRETLLVAYHTPTRVLGQRVRRMRHPPSATSHEPSAISHQLSASSHEPNHIWALKDVSFEVKRGEAVGIIGRNGSGKSTLLKILSRITAPTEGCAEIRGRVGSLLEVGTGFHPELTGRENIYLNGAIIGMKKAEIDRRFDEIVAFAEIEKFLDTPVKRYSSGMYVRLAFAVAAHLEPEVLVVDEVLAVGDAEFQKKCLGKMQSVTGEGRTVLFVSHQMNAIRRLCERCVWMDAGHIKMSGSTGAVVGGYEQSASGEPLHLGAIVGAADAPAKFLQWGIVEPRTEHPNVLVTAGPVKFKITVKVNTPIRDASHGITLRDSDQQLIWAWVTHHLDLRPGVHEFTYCLRDIPLRPGAYSWHVSLYKDQRTIDEWHCLPQLVIATPPFGLTTDEWSGVLNMRCEFELLEAERG